MKELVEVIAKALVDNPEEVVVTESMKGEDTLIELKVSPADMGKVIGPQGWRFIYCPGILSRNIYP